MTPKVDAMIDATVAVIVAFEHGHDLRKPLSDLAIAHHHLLGERPCIRCDQWTPSDSGYCERCEVPATPEGCSDPEAVA